MTEEKNIPPPPVTPSGYLNKDIHFYGILIEALDKQFQFMEDNKCYGKISIEFKFWNGKMTDKTTLVEVNDRVVSEKKV